MLIAVMLLHFAPISKPWAKCSVSPCKWKFWPRKVSKSNKWIRAWFPTSPIFSAKPTESGSVLLNPVRDTKQSTYSRGVILEGEIPSYMGSMKCVPILFPSFKAFMQFEEISFIFQNQWAKAVGWLLSVHGWLHTAASLTELYAEKHVWLMHLGWGPTCYEHLHFETGCCDSTFSSSTSIQTGEISTAWKMVAPWCVMGQAAREPPPAFQRGSSFDLVEPEGAVCETAECKCKA